MKKNKKTIILIVSIISLLLIVLGSTYAWFSYRSLNTNISFVVNGLEIDYKSGNTITGKLVPVYDIDNENVVLNTIEVKSNNENLASITFKLDINTLPEELQEESFVYKLYRDGILVDDGNFKDVNEGDTIIVSENQVVANDIVTYKLYIYIDANMDNPIDMMDKAFEFKIYGEVTNKIDTITKENPTSIIGAGSGALINYNIYGNSVGTELPSEYQQLSYIESTGTQYIDMKYTYKINDEINVDFMQTGNNGAIQGIFGNGNQSTYKGISLYINASNVLTSTIGGILGHDFKQIKPISENVKYSIKYNGNGVYIDNNLVGNVTNTLSDGTQEDFSLFRRWNTNTLIGRIYKFNVKRNGEYIFNLMPCYRKSDNIIGMYDIANNKFYTNSGTGTFKRPSISFVNIENVGDQEVLDGSIYYNIPINITGPNMEKYQYYANQEVNNTTGYDEDGNTILAADAAIYIGDRKSNTYLISQKLNSSTVMENIMIFYDETMTAIEYPDVTFTPINSEAWKTVGGYPSFKYSPAKLNEVNSWYITVNDENIKYLMLRSRNSATISGYATERNVQNVINREIHLEEPLRKVGSNVDYVDFINKKVVRKVEKYIFTGEENWKLEKSSENYTKFSLENVLSIYKGNNCLSNFPVFSNGTTSNIEGESGIGLNKENNNNNSNIVYIEVPSDIASTIEELKEYIKANGIYILYPLYEEKSISIDLPKLEVFSGATTYKINTNIKPSKFSITYYGV